MRRNTSIVVDVEGDEVLERQPALAARPRSAARSVSLLKKLPQRAHHDADGDASCLPARPGCRTRARRAGSAASRPRCRASRRASGRAPRRGRAPPAPRARGCASCVSQERSIVSCTTLPAQSGSAESFFSRWISGSSTDGVVGVEVAALARHEGVVARDRPREGVGTAGCLAARQSSDIARTLARGPARQDRFASAVRPPRCAERREQDEPLAHRQPDGLGQAAAVELELRRVVRGLGAAPAPARCASVL